MFTINDDMSIYVTRGDTAIFGVAAVSGEENYKFQAGDVIRFKVTEKKACENVVFYKDFPITQETERVEILLTEDDTKIGDVISKPTDYWYEVEWNPFTNPQTIIGYDDDGPKVFKLFPEGANVPNTPIEPEDIPVVDTELDQTSDRPVQNQAIARAVVALQYSQDTIIKGMQENHEQTEKTLADFQQEIADNSRETKRAYDVLNARMNTFTTLQAGSTTGDAELTDGRVDYEGNVHTNIGEHIREVSSQLSSEIAHITEEYGNLYKVENVEVGKTWANATDTGKAICYCDVKPNTEYVIEVINNKFSYVNVIAKPSKEINTNLANVQFNLGGETIQKGVLTTTDTSNVIAIQFAKTDITIDDFDSLYLKVYDKTKGCINAVDKVSRKKLDDITEVYSANLFKAKNVEIGKSWNNVENAGRAIWYYEVTPNTGYTISVNNDRFSTALLVEKPLREVNTNLANIQFNITEEKTVNFVTTENTNVIVIQFAKTDISIDDFTDFEIFICETNKINGITSVDYKAREEIEKTNENIRNISIFDGVEFSLFKKWGVIGDSLSVGHTKNADGTQAHGRNIYYSWPQYLARRIGNTCLNFGKSGASAESWMNVNDQYCYSRLIDPNNLCQAYIIALGANDTAKALGSINDVDFTDMSNNSDTEYGWYARVINAVRTTAPLAPIFLFTLPYPRNGDVNIQAINNMIRELANNEHFEKVYLVDLDANYNKFFNSGKLLNCIGNTGWHLTPLGYLYASKVNEIALSEVIADNYADFQDVFLIPYGSTESLD